MANVKVLHIISSPSAGGAEVFVKDMVLNSKKNGLDTAVLFVSDAKNVGRSSAYENSYLSELTAAGIPFFILPQNARRNVLQGRKAFKACIASFSPHCIHAHLLAGIIYSKLFCKRIPVIYTHHSSVIKTHPFIFKALMKKCHAHIGISKTCAQFLQQYLPQKSRCRLIYNALDSKRLLPVQKANKDQNLSLLAVGRISKEKNYLHMLKAITEAKKALDIPFCLKIAGEGTSTEKALLIDYINAHDLDDNVILLGNRSDIPSLLAQTDIFLMSSAWEGLPIALLEAQFAGLPSLVTDVGGCSELLNITKGGLTTPVDDVGLYAQHLIALIKNKNLRDSLHIAALSNINEFSIDHCLIEHKKLYQEQTQG